MIYLYRDATDGNGRPATLTASAEKEKTAQKLEARGYLRCTYARWKAARQKRDAQDQRRLAVGDGK